MASQASAGVGTISILAALTQAAIRGRVNSPGHRRSHRGTRPTVAALTARPTGSHFRRQRLKLLGRDAAGIVLVAGENHVVEPAQQLLQHAANVLFLRRGEDQQPPAGGKALGEHFDQRADRGGVVGGVEHDRRPPRDNFHPRRPDQLGQSAANGRLGNRPAASRSSSTAASATRRIGRLMPAQQPECKSGCRR